MRGRGRNYRHLLPQSSASTDMPPALVVVLGTIDVAERGSAESDRSGRDPWVAGCPFPCICAVRRRDGQSFARRPALSRTPRAQRSLQAKAKHGGSPFDGQNPRALEQHRGPFRPLRLTWTIYFAFVRRVTLVPASLGPPAVRIVLRRLRVPRSGTSPRSYDGPNAWLSGLTLKRPQRDHGLRHVDWPPLPQRRRE